MDLEGLSPLDKLARARMSTVSLAADSPILAEMPPPFDLFRTSTHSTRNIATKHAPPPLPRDSHRPSTSPPPSAHSMPSPAPSRSATLVSENLDLQCHTNDSCQTLDEEDFDWSEKSNSKVSLLGWLQTQPSDAMPAPGSIRHGPSRSWDLSHSLEPPSAPPKHQKSSSLSGYSSAEYTSEPMLTPPPLIDTLEDTVHRGARLVESGDKDGGVKCWRAAKDAGNLYARLLYFLAVDAGWTFDAAHPDLGALLTRVNPQSLRNILGTDCPRIADALYGFSTRQPPAVARQALTMAATINRAGRPVH